jgi:hypothetical protein
MGARPHLHGEAFLNLATIRLTATRQPAHRLAAALLGSIFLLAFVAAPAYSATNPASPETRAGKIPRTKDGKPDFSGIWQTTSAAEDDLEPHQGRIDAPPGPGVVTGGEIPYLPKALEQKRKNFESRQTADPASKCLALGVPRAVYHREPFQIFQRQRDLTLLHQFGGNVRTIHTNRTEHPADPNEWWQGDSRGKWVGDTLVVDVKHFNDITWLDRAGNFHSDALQVVERWRFLDANTIEYQATIEDDKVFSRPWDLTVLLHRHREKNFQIVENYCFTRDYEQHYPPQRPADAPR